MDNNKSNFRRGSVELMVLYLLSLRDYYGYELTQILKEQTNGVMDIPVGSLYPALYKLIDAGLISDYKMPAGKCLMRVYYHLEASGKKRLELLLKDYRETHEAINNILNYTGDEEIHE